MGNTIIGYQIQVFIVDVNMNKSNQTLSVGNVNSTEVDMLCELELWKGQLSRFSLRLCQLSVCGLSVVKFMPVFDCDLSNVLKHD